MCPSIRDGAAFIGDNGKCAPNYWPNSFDKCKTDDCGKEHCEKLVGDVNRYDASNDYDFEQVTQFWEHVLTPEERERLVQNIADNMKGAELFVQQKAILNFDKVHVDFGTKLRSLLNLPQVN